jgi:hypothetical protein
LFILIVNPNGINGEIRTIKTAKIASDAIFGIQNDRRMISLGVKLPGCAQNLHGTKLYAKSATLAPFRIDMNLSLESVSGLCFLRRRHDLITSSNI